MCRTAEQLQTQHEQWKQELQEKERRERKLEEQSRKQQVIDKQKWDTHWEQQLQQVLRAEGYRYIGT